ncbi:MAG: VWA domain-containing protein [Thermoleophilia bacterium]
MSPRAEQLVRVRARLEGEALDFALSQERRLADLEPAELELWAELATLVAAQRPRERQGFIAAAADGLAALSAASDLRDEVREWSREWTRRSGRLGAAFFRLCRELLPRVSADAFRETVSMARDLDQDADVAMEFMAWASTLETHGGTALLRASRDGALVLCRADRRAARGFLEAMGRAAGSLTAAEVPALAEASARTAERSRHAAKELFRMLPALAAGMPAARIARWIEEGLRLTSREDDLVLYLSYGPSRSHLAVEVLCRTASLGAYRSRIALILEAFLGRPAAVRNMFDVLDPASVPHDVPAFVDGESIYLRPTLSCASLPTFSFYRLVALHAAAHERFTSPDDLSPDDLSPDDRIGHRSDGDDPALSDLDRFLFAVAEDHRVDSALLRTLPGLRGDAEKAVRHTYARYDARYAHAETVPLSPASLRAHAASFRFGVRILETKAQATLVERVLEPLSLPSATRADSKRAADELKATLGDRLMEFLLSDPAEWAAFSGSDAPHPPYYDYLLLGGADTGSKGVPEGRGAADPRLLGATRDASGSPDLGEVVEALGVTAGEWSGTVDKFDLGEDGSPEDGTDWETHSYPEWDAEKGVYRPDWCTVRCRDMRAGDPAFVTDTIARYRGEVHLIRRQFERLSPKRMQRFFRQQDGDELDLNALVDALADREAGAPMSGKVFVRRDKKQRDVAVLFLLDMSDSTDQLVADGQRVVDVEKQGLVLLSEAVDRIGDRCAVMGFASHGRHRVDIFRIKHFQEPFDRAVAGRISGVEPSGYTRLGAALRRAADHLSGVEAGVRLLVLLSDGRPYDLSYGDMRYAMEDTKAALAEIGRAGMKVFCITVDPEGPAYLEHMFGANRYTVIQDVTHLPTRLPRIYRNLTT